MPEGPLRSGGAPLPRVRPRQGRRQPLLHPHPNLRIPHQLQHAGGGPPVELEVGGGVVKHRQLEGTLVLPVAGHPQAGHQRLQLREAAVERECVHGGWGGGLHSPWGWGVVNGTAKVGALRVHSPPTPITLDLCR